MNPGIEALCKRYPDWSLVDGHLVRTWTFAEAAEAVELVLRIVAQSMTQDHHPEMTWNHRVVSVRLTTHEGDGPGPRDICWVETLEADDDQAKTRASKA